MNPNGNLPLRSRLLAYLELFLVLLLMMLLAAVSARAEELPPPVALDGVGCGSLLLPTAEPGLYLPAPTLDTEVTIEVTGFVARTRVRQRFQNPAGEWVEGVYVFPLPDAAAVDTLRLRVGERTIEGQIQERRVAKQIYDQANREGKKAALVEQERPNIFTTSITQLGPGRGRGGRARVPGRAAVRPRNASSAVSHGGRTSIRAESRKRRRCGADIAAGSPRPGGRRR